MRKTLAEPIFMVTLVITLYLLSTLPTYAASPSLVQRTTHVTSLSQKSQETRPQCQHLVVYLHGTNNSTWKCDDQSSKPGRISPDIYTTDCSSSALAIYNEYPLGNWSICFLGAGSANMTSYCPPLYAGGCADGNWNDQADYYQTGCSKVWFYSDINEGGTAQYEKAHEFNDFDGELDSAGYYTLYDNTLSSVQLLSSCTSG
jgi:hypothetical protein